MSIHPINGSGVPKRSSRFSLVRHLDHDAPIDAPTQAVLGASTSIRQVLEILSETVEAHASWKSDGHHGHASSTEN